MHMGNEELRPYVRLNNHQSFKDGNLQYGDGSKDDTLWQSNKENISYISGA